MDSKFFVHHGDYIVQDISGIRELVVSDVNLIHRLTKNHITEQTGWHAYTLFTDRTLEHINIRPEGLHAQTESYEHLGAISTQSMDIHPRIIASNEGHPEKEIARRAAGDVVGEMSLISGDTRIASVIALGDVRVLCIDRLNFESLLRERPEVSLAVMRELCKRLKERSN